MKYFLNVFPASYIGIENLKIGLTTELNLNELLERPDGMETSKRRDCDLIFSPILIIFISMEWRPQKEGIATWPPVVHR